MGRMPTAEVIPAVPVPFDGRDHIDGNVFRSLLARIDQHVDGAFVAGTTGEFPALADDERRGLFAAGVEVLGADRVVAHVGTASIGQTLRVAESAVALGIDRIAAITPYYLGCDFAQIRAGYEALAGAFPGIGVFVYLYPDRSGVEVGPAQLGELTAIEGIAGAKISGRPNAHLADYLAAVAPGSRVYSGDDSALVGVAGAGGRGVVSAVASAYPERFGALRAALRSGDAEGVAQADGQVQEAVRLLSPSLARLKYALAHRHGETWNTRMAVPAVDPDTAAAIRALT